MKTGMLLTAACIGAMASPAFADDQTMQGAMLTAGIWYQASKVCDNPHLEGLATRLIAQFRDAARANPDVAKAAFADGIRIAYDNAASSCRDFPH